LPTTLLYSRFSRIIRMICEKLGTPPAVLVLVGVGVIDGAAVDVGVLEGTDVGMGVFD
jgi:hypothetical protein